VRRRGEISFGDRSEFPIAELSLVWLCMCVCVCVCVLAERGRTGPDHEALAPCKRSLIYNV
jgi:hypothetical protein